MPLSHLHDTGGSMDRTTLERTIQQEQSNALSRYGASGDPHNHSDASVSLHPAESVLKPGECSPSSLSVTYDSNSLKDLPSSQSTSDNQSLLTGQPPSMQHSQEQTSYGRSSSVSIAPTDFPLECLEEPQFDFIMLSCSKDYDDAEKLMDKIEENLRERCYVVKAAMYDDASALPKPVSTGFTVLEALYDRANFLFVFVSRNFKRDAEAEFHKEENIIKSFTDPNKRHTVVPVFGESRSALGDLPYGFRSLIPLETARGNFHSKVYNLLTRPEAHQRKLQRKNEILKEQEKFKRTIASTRKEEARVDNMLQQQSHALQQQHDQMAQIEATRQFSQQFQDTHDPVATAAAAVSRNLPPTVASQTRAPSHLLPVAATTVTTAPAQVYNISGVTNVQIGSRTENITTTTTNAPEPPPTQRHIFQVVEEEPGDTSVPSNRSTHSGISVDADRNMAGTMTSTSASGATCGNQQSDDQDQSFSQDTNPKRVVSSSINTTNSGMSRSVGGSTLDVQKGSHPASSSLSCGDMSNISSVTTNKDLPVESTTHMMATVSISSTSSVPTNTELPEEAVSDPNEGNLSGPMRNLRGTRTQQSENYDHLEQCASYNSTFRSSATSAPNGQANGHRIIHQQDFEEEPPTSPSSLEVESSSSASQRIQEVTDELHNMPGQIAGCSDTANVQTFDPGNIQHNDLNNTSQPSSALSQGEPGSQLIPEFPENLQSMSDTSSLPMNLSEEFGRASMQGEGASDCGVGGYPSGELVQGAGALSRPAPDTVPDFHALGVQPDGAEQREEELASNWSSTSSLCLPYVLDNGELDLKSIEESGKSRFGTEV